MTKLAPCLLLLAACSPSNANPSPPGTNVLHWQLGDSDRTEIRTARQTDTKTTTLAYEAHPTDDTSIKLNVTLDTATVTFGDPGKEVTHSAPTRLVLTVADAGDFTLSAPKCMGPHYDMALPPSRDMILHCTVKAKKPRYDVGFTIYAYGDGRIDDGVMKKRKLL